MKILQITSRKIYLKKAGGVQIYLENLYNFLKKYGHEIYILSPKSIKENKIQNLEPFIKTSKNSKSPIIGYKIFPLIKFIIKEKKNFDLFSIHSHTYLAVPILIFLLRVIIRRSTVLTIHGLNESIRFERISVLLILRLLIRLFWRLIAWFSCLLSNKVIFVSKIDMIKLKKMFTPKIYKKFQWIPNSIKITLNINTHEFNKRKYFTFIGDLNSQIKGFDIFIQIMKYIYNYLNFKIPVLIVGDGPLRSLISKNKAILEIKHLRYINHENISSVYRKTKIFLLTSRSEGLPTTLLEALYYKIPIVATDIPATRQIIINNYNGVLFPPDDPEMGFIRIKEILNNRKFREMIEMNGSETVKNFYSWEKNSKKIMKIYSDLI